MILVNQLISAILQLILFSFIPFVWYVIKEKHVKGFRLWIGIKTIEGAPIKNVVLIFVTFLLVTIVPYSWLYQAGNMNYQGFTFQSFSQSGWSIQTILIIIIWSVIQTSLSEEILFRGFLCKRLSSKWKEVLFMAGAFTLWLTLFHLSLYCYF